MHAHDDSLQQTTGAAWRVRLLSAGAAMIIGLALSSTAPADEMSRETKRSADAQHDQTVRQAKADYKAARAKCNDLGGNPKDVCIKEAKAAEKSALAEAKAEKKSSSAHAEAGADKREGELKVAKAKCDAMSGNAKDSCQKEAEATYRQ